MWCMMEGTKIRYSEFKIRYNEFLKNHYDKFSKVVITIFCKVITTSLKSFLLVQN